MPEMAVPDNRAMATITDSPAEVTLHPTDKMVSLPELAVEEATTMAEEIMVSLQEATVAEAITQIRVSRLRSQAQQTQQGEGLRVTPQEEVMIRDNVHRSVAGKV